MITRLSSSGVGCLYWPRKFYASHGRTREQVTARPAHRDPFGAVGSRDVQVRRRVRSPQGAAAASLAQLLLCVFLHRGNGDAHGRVPC